mmetsp:Transcript_33212/g.53479  ORF Transcript_33212/g.53479 Transcript_33212/m.53479 type:complete len:225 (-) Transcript_33212:247-921(-)
MKTRAFAAVASLAVPCTVAQRNFRAANTAGSVTIVNEWNGWGECQYVNKQVLTMFGTVSGAQPPIAKGETKKIDFQVDSHGQMNLGFQENGWYWREETSSNSKSGDNYQWADNAGGNFLLDPITCKGQMVRSYHDPATPPLWKSFQVKSEKVGSGCQVTFYATQAQGLKPSGKCAGPCYSPSKLNTQVCQAGRPDFVSSTYCSTDCVTKCQKQWSCTTNSGISS